MPQNKLKKRSAGVRLRPQEHAGFGMTVTVEHVVERFAGVTVYLRMPFGLRLPLTEKDYILVLLPSSAFVGSARAGLSVYLTRQGIGLASRCPRGTRLMVDFLEESNGIGPVFASVRKPDSHLEMTGFRG